MNFAVCVQAILLSPKFHCAEEILTIVSLLSVDSVLHNPPAQRDEVQAVRKKFISSEGDHLTLLNVYRAYKSVSGNKVGGLRLPLLLSSWGEEFLAQSRVTPAPSTAGATGILQSREKRGELKEVQWQKLLQKALVKVFGASSVITARVLPSLVPAGNRREWESVET